MKKALLAVLLAAVFAAGCGSGSEFTASTTLSPEDGPAVVMLGTTERGRVLTDGMGRSLYLFSKDRPNTSACRGDCAATWPPHLLGERPLREGPGVRGDLLGTVRRPDGTRQVSYAGHPLHYFAGDLSPGRAVGQNLHDFGGRWFLVTAAGERVRP